MPQHEFEDYLGLLGRMLRLARSEREGIASELRDHLQERLDELTAEGVSKAAAPRDPPAKATPVGER